MADLLVKAPLSAKPCFAITETDAGDWTARERRSGIERRFQSQQAALHYVLFNVGAHNATALLTPRPAQKIA